MSEGIVVQGLWKRFGSFDAVKDVGFEAEDGKITALLGPSGSGKSTVLRMIAGLERPDAGRIWVGGEEQTGKSVQERRFGFVFQHYALFRHMTVSRNVAFGLSVRKESKAVQRSRVNELLELVGLAPFANRYPDQLSGGQRQRVALARALAPQPRLLLLDEPFGALDARVRQELRRWLDDLHRELGVTSLLVTHDQDEALELANEVVVMHQGRVEQIGTADEVYNRPVTAFVAGFVGATNIVNGHVSGGRLRLADGEPADAGHLSEGEKAQAYVRSHDVRLTSAAENGAVSATVERITNMGWTAKIHLRLADGQVLLAQLPNEEVDWIRPGAQVFADLRDPKVFSAASAEDAAKDSRPAEVSDAVVVPSREATPQAP
jgi:sulfate transport system ATP-binding protein